MLISMGAHTNREIKFRVLNALNNMVYFSIFHSGIEGGTFKSPIMQFTGLKDTKGKEIYEGDILKFHQSVLWSKYKGEVFKDTEAVVIWYEGYGLSGFTLKVTGRPHLSTLDASNGEVIGNIYENPEILPKDAQNHPSPV